MATVIVYHETYGCDTGCCGHVIKLSGCENPDDNHSSFEFDHPMISRSQYADTAAYEAALLEWARDFVHRELGAEHVADLAWEDCIINEY